MHIFCPPFIPAHQTPATDAWKEEWVRKEDICLIRQSVYYPNDGSDILKLKEKQWYQCFYVQKCMWTCLSKVLSNQRDSHCCETSITQLHSVTLYQTVKKNYTCTKWYKKKQNHHHSF